MSYDEAIFQMYLGEVPMFQACSEEELSAIAYLASPQRSRRVARSSARETQATTSSSS